MGKFPKIKIIYNKTGHLHPDSFQLYDLILLPGLLNCSTPGAKYKTKFWKIESPSGLFVKQCFWWLLSLAF